MVSPVTVIGGGIYFENNFSALLVLDPGDLAKLSAAAQIAAGSAGAVAAFYRHGIGAAIC